MIRIILLSTAIVTGTLVAESAAAFGGSPDPASRPSFAQLDADGDGKLTAGEMQAYRTATATARFQAADADGDGLISNAELTEAFERMRSARNAGRTDAIMDRFDTDKDGAISEAELTASVGADRRAAPGARLFARADTDGDGAISEAEFDAAVDRMQKRAGRFAKQGAQRGGQAPFWRN